ncbi:MAG: M16 family metallopeptidase [Acidimicrobiales bacterium]
MRLQDEKAKLERFALGNGLKVIAAPDHSSPLVGVSVVYDVGFRTEPEGRTGFAHLFEHLMFQGSANVAKIEHVRLVEAAGGVFNGHTLADLTAYYEAVPSGALELALWLEADRMRALAVTEENLRNQIDVVEEEIKVNVLNQPYGGFPWLVLPELAFDSYPNAHNGYGDFAHLERATVEEAAEFYASYYAPSNAVLTVAGDCDPDEVLQFAERHFGDISGKPRPPQGPWPEPPLETERRRVIDDAFAPQPAFVVGCRTPDPVANIDLHLAYSVAASLLGDGEASRLRSRLVHRDHTVTDVSCRLGIFGMDNFFMRDPVLFQIVVRHPGVATTDELLAAIDEELRRLATEGPTPDELGRVAASTASDYWKGMDSVMERSIALGSLEVVHRRAELARELPGRLAAVSAAEVAAAAMDLSDQAHAIVEIRPAPTASL